MTVHGTIPNQNYNLKIGDFTINNEFHIVCHVDLVMPRFYL